MAKSKSKSKSKAKAKAKKIPKNVATILSMKDVKTWLLRQDKKKLTVILLEAASEDDQLASRLMLMAAVAEGDNLATYQKIIDQAIDSGDDYVEYHGMHDYWRGVTDAIDAIRGLLKQGSAEMVIELCEYALERAERAIEYIDDHDGDMIHIMEDLQELHLAACKKAKPDPVRLAERLFCWGLRSDWDVFSDAIEFYSSVLGKTGRAHYRELAEAEWSGIKQRGPGNHHQWNSRRSRVTRIMESLAEIEGDTEALVAIKRKDLSSSDDFLKIAETYQQDRQGDKALEWAEQGIEAFGQRAGSRLQDFLANLYHRRKRHDEAMSLIWIQFENSPTLRSYQHLKKHAGWAKTWSTWRDQALAYVRGEINKNAAAAGSGSCHYGQWANHSLLVEIFIWEKDIASAWREARQGGCSDTLWLQLAKLSEKEQPQDAISVYRERIAPIVEQTSNRAYAEAVVLLRRIEKLMNGLGEQIAFRRYLNILRETYKRKRNFIRLLQSFPS